MLPFTGHLSSKSATPSGGRASLSCSLHVPCSFHVPFVLPPCPHVPSVFPSVPSMFLSCSFHVPFMLPSCVFDPVMSFALFQRSLNYGHKRRGAIYIYIYIYIYILSPTGARARTNLFPLFHHRSTTVPLLHH